MLDYAFDVATVRERFPALARTHGGQPVIYFDNPAGTQVPREMIDGYRRYLESSNANTGGLFATSRESDAIVEACREAVAELLGASPGEIVFGPNMTTLTFALSRAIGCALGPGDEIVTTRLEHDANVAPWLALQERGVTVRFIDVHPEDMTLDMEGAEEAISDRTRLLAIGYASNAFGTINDVRTLTRLAHAHGAWVFVDAVHFGPHGSINVADLGVDFLVCSAYKFFGPHLGVLYGRRDLLATLPAYKVRPASDEPPGRWETGTQNHEALCALLGTLQYLASLSPRSEGDRKGVFREAMERVREYERTLQDRLLAGMGALPSVTVYGITQPGDFDRRVPTVSFRVEGLEPTELARALGDRGIFSWAGTHYAVEPMQRLGLAATNRIGLVHYNTVEEIDRFVEVLEDLSRG